MERPNLDFGKLKVRSTLVKQADANIYNPNKTNVGEFDNLRHKDLYMILNGRDVAKKRRLSRWYASKNGIYNRSVFYMSDIFKFDYYIYPVLVDGDHSKKKKQILKQFENILSFFDKSSLQLLCRNWLRAVCLDGCYYGYICEDITDRLYCQDLPIDWCRSRFNHRGVPIVEFNVQYFDRITTIPTLREKYLNLFPKEIQKGYLEYKQNHLNAEEFGDRPGWIMLDINRAFKFSFNENDTPPFLSAIPALFDLEEVQGLEKEKLLQQIQKLLIQEFELDKNGQIPFTMPELQQLNQNAVDMVGDAVGVSVLSTVGKVHLEELAAETSKESTGALDEAQNMAYNYFGISTNLFNTDGNIALDKSTTIDEAFIKPILFQFQRLLNQFVEMHFNSKKTEFRLTFLPTTIFNYDKISDKYKELTKLGFSRFLPMVALGHSQREIVSLAHLENDVLDLDSIMVAPFSSANMSTAARQELKGQGSTTSSSTNKTASEALKEESHSGRPELPDEEKSDKTLANEAAIG